MEAEEGSTREGNHGGGASAHSKRRDGPVAPRPEPSLRSTGGALDHGPRGTRWGRGRVGGGGGRTRVRVQRRPPPALAPWLRRPHRRGARPLARRPHRPGRGGEI